MKTRHLVLGAAAMIAVGLLGFAAGVSVGQEKKTRVYELRTYTTLPGRLPVGRSSISRSEYQPPRNRINPG